MPSTIPYDPSLVLLNVVSDKALNLVTQIATENAPVDAAKDALNSLIATKRSLTMTKTELKNLGVGTDDLDKEIQNLNKGIEGAAVQYSKTKLAAEPKIQGLRSQMRMVNASIESPADYLRCDMKTMPLAADSLNMDVQYFSFDQNSQDSATYSAQIASYVSASVGVLGTKKSVEVGSAVNRQVSRQISKHSISGTLVLSAVCTHKNATVVAPLIVHPDKAIKVWNHLFPGSKLDPTDRASMMKVCMNESKEDKQKFSIISGVTYGSSFVGMVHVLNTTSTDASESLSAATHKLSASMDAGGWFAKKSGKVGVDSKFGDDVKNLLSSQNIQSHVTLLTTGVIPSMVATDVSIAVKEYLHFDPKSSMEQVAALQNATATDQASVKVDADAARSGGQAADLEGKKVTAALEGLANIESGKNKILDINSMMTAFDDYLKKAQSNSGGVPLNYYLKDFDIKSLAQLWTAKYFPGEYMAIRIDDSESAGSAAGQEKAKL